MSKPSTPIFLDLVKQIPFGQILFLVKRNFVSKYFCEEKIVKVNKIFWSTNFLGQILLQNKDLNIWAKKVWSTKYFGQKSFQSKNVGHIKIFGQQKFVVTKYCGPKKCLVKKKFVVKTKFLIIKVFD